jgi:hypothetical protein
MLFDFVFILPVMKELMGITAATKITRYGNQLTAAESSNASPAFSRSLDEESSSLLQWNQRNGTEHA